MQKRDPDDEFRDASGEKVDELTAFFIFRGKIRPFLKIEFSCELDE